jgi:hypothetical protein
MTFVSRAAPRAVAAALLAVLALGAAPAHADDATAETLYRDGKRAAAAKDWDLACRKFKESQEREPAPGTLMNLADCEENRGHLLAAITSYQAAAPWFKAGDERAAFSRQRSALLEKHVARVVVRLGPDAPPGSTVERDGAPVEAASLGTVVRLDPGEHTFVVRAPGRPDARTALRFADGESKEVQLAPGAVAAPPVAAAPSHAVAPSSWRPPAPDRTAAFVAFGVGGAGLVTGTVAGVLALGAAGTAHDGCPNQVCTSQEGVDAASRAKTLGLVSTLGLGVGVLGVAAGAFFWVKASPTVMVGPAVGRAPGLVLRGEL